MRTELALSSFKEKVALENVEVVKIGSDYPYLRNALTDHYFRAWRNEGLCESLNEAKRRLDKYHEQGVLESSFMITSPQKEVIYSLLLTTNIKADSLFDLLLKIPKYRSFENPILEKNRGEIGFSVCFSITAEGGLCVKKGGGDVSLSRFNLFEFEAPEGYFKAAYSRFNSVGRKNIQKFYLKNVATPRKLGATGMHENAYGGVTLAIIRGSRPEDALGGHSNSFILLPRDETQREINAQIMERRKKGFVPYERVGNFLLFGDIWPYLSLAR